MKRIFKLLKRSIAMVALQLFFMSFVLYAQQKSDAVKVTITNVGNAINTSFPEYAPIISADGSMIVFASRRPVDAKDIKKGKPGLESIYVSYYDDKTNKWSDATRMEETINEPFKNNSPIALSNDGQRMLVFRDDEDGNGDIYESFLNGKEWSKLVRLPSPINSDDYESSASISPDGRIFYFISDRKGGEGGRDIWMCKQGKDGKWGQAKNLGKAINTPQDEEGVFIHPDGKTIYFSSKGHNTMGGYDVFKSVFEKGKWSKPVNLGAPINTTGDDVCFVLTADGKTGYYASSKPGGLGDKDIYEVKFTSTEKQKDEPRLTLFKGVVIDNAASTPLESEMEITDNGKNESVAKIKSNSLTGKFLISLPAGKNYGIAVKKEGYLFYSENFNIPDTAAYQEINKTIPLQKINVGNKIVLKNIFYDFDKATLHPESMSELEQLVQLMKNNPTMRIELSSYTDSKGTDEYNQKLSQARAQSVTDYLIGKGITGNRLVTKGYGESMPIASNDTEEGRQLNRRTEFKILEK